MTIQKRSIQNMKKLTGKRAAIIGVIFACAIAVGWGGPSLFTYVQLRSDMDDELHPIWREFDSGQLRNGSNLSTLIKLHPPAEQFEIGPFSELLYLQESNSSVPTLPFSGVRVTAKSGVLVRASADSCTWSNVFFNSLSQADEAELQRLQAKLHATLKAEAQPGPR